MEPNEKLKQAVKNYREGKKEAFTALYEESSKYIYTCIWKVIGGSSNAQDAVNDIMQDTYVEISKNIAQLDREESFLSWAGTIAIRKCYGWLKKNRKYVLFDEDDGGFENLADDDAIIPEEVMQDREKQRLVREILEQQLTEVQKICIIAYYYNEQKQSEIARELGIPENTVKTNLSRAKAKIRDGVLDLEKKQGTRLYSIAPLLVLFLREDLYGCVVPKTVAAGVNGAVAAVGGIGRTALLGKLAAVSVKVKVAVGIISVGVIAVIGGTVYIATQNKEDAAQKEQQEILEELNRELALDEDHSAENEAEKGDETEEEKEPADETGADDGIETDVETIPEQTEITLSEKEQQDLETLITLLTLDSYFYGGVMEGYQYPLQDMGMFVRLMNIVGSFSTMDAFYEEYLPQMEIDTVELQGYAEVAEIQSYIENLFGIENADLSAYCEGDKVKFDLYLDRMGTEVSIDSVMAGEAGSYEISGSASVIEFGPTVSTFSYQLTVIKNENSAFGYQVISMGYAAP